MTSLFSLFKKPKPEPVSRIARLTYAIGDIHGCNDLFGGLIDGIKRDAERLGQRPCLVLLGDYVDRGPQSKQVIDRVLAIRDEGWCDLVSLMGNHEQALLQFLESPAKGNEWCDHGGAATLISYGVTPPQMRSKPEHWTSTRDAFLQALGDRHLAFYRSLELYYISGDYLFVHAGVSPKKILSEQTADTFLWIREPFLSSEKACDYVVVHGHTPEKDPFSARWRIGLDTGAYATKTLSSVRLVDDKRHFILIKPSV